MAVPYRVRPGGLMRCCIETLTEAMKNATTEPKDGDTMLCAYCKPENGGMIFRDGAWEWNRPESMGPR
jgi:hypothetical protein